MPETPGPSQETNMIKVVGELVTTVVSEHLKASSARLETRLNQRILTVAETIGEKVEERIHLSQTELEGRLVKSVANLIHTQIQEVATRKATDAAKAFLSSKEFKERLLEASLGGDPSKAPQDPRSSLAMVRTAVEERLGEIDLDQRIRDLLAKGAEAGGPLAAAVKREADQSISTYLLSNDYAFIVREAVKSKIEDEIGKMRDAMRTEARLAVAGYLAGDEGRKAVADAAAEAAQKAVETGMGQVEKLVHQTIESALEQHRKSAPFTRRVRAIAKDHLKRVADREREKEDDLLQSVEERIRSLSRDFYASDLLKGVVADLVRSHLSRFATRDEARAIAEETAGKRTADREDDVYPVIASEEELVPNPKKGRRKRLHGG